VSINLDELERLAKAASEGPWTDGGDGDLVGSLGQPLIKGEYGYEGYFAWDEDAAYCAAANPTAILELVAEVRRLREDAERYRWLRRRDLDTIDMGGLFVGLVPDNLVINDIDLDQSIDAARAKEKL